MPKVTLPVRRTVPLVILLGATIALACACSKEKPARPSSIHKESSPAVAPGSPVEHPTTFIDATVARRQVTYTRKSPGAETDGSLPLAKKGRPPTQPSDNPNASPNSGRKAHKEQIANSIANEPVIPIAIPSSTQKPTLQAKRPIPAPPQLFTVSEAAQLLPAGSLRKAKRLNKKGFRARKNGNNAEALALYREAVEASPSYGRARFNLACELALDGQTSAAIAELTILYRSGGKGDHHYLAAATADEDLHSLWALPAFLSLVDGLAEHRRLRTSKVLKGGCHGFSARTGAMACGYYSKTDEWCEKAGGVLFGSETHVFAVHDEDEEVNESGAMESSCLQERVAPLKLPKYHLRRGKEMALGDTGYFATWSETPDSPAKVEFRGPGGVAEIAIGREGFVTGGDAVPYNNPDEVLFWLAPSGGRGVVETRFGYTGTREPKDIPYESWNALALLVLSDDAEPAEAVSGLP
jgi:hypothetical protein